MDAQGPLADLIRRARRRHLGHLAFHQFVFAVSLALAALIALLLLGTGFLSTLWIGAFFAFGLALGVFRAKRAMLSPYQIAQRLDGKLQFQDTLSTAHYFAENAAERGGREDVIDRQLVAAEAAARTADLKVGLPMVIPRSLYAASILLMAAVAILAVRYGVTRSLDLRSSLVQIAFEGLLGQNDTVASAKKKGNGKSDGERPKEDTLHVDAWESKQLDAQGPTDDALKTVDTPDVNNQNYEGPKAEAKAEGAPTPDPVQQAGDSAESGDKSKEANGDQTAENSPSSPNKDGKGGKQQDGQDKKDGGQSDNSSLADKMRDALSNLMSKLKNQPKQNDGKQGNGQSQQGQQNAQNKKQDEKGAQQQGKSQDANASQDQQSDQEGQSSEKSASAQNKSGSKGADRPPTQDGKSGVGKEDGDKSAREAEQLAAMGKISELIGKRAQNMQGEVMVEVSSGKQQLKTQYSRTNASHVGTGGESNRDEVPLAYQRYVQQYFESIHKPSAAGQSVKDKKSGGN